MKTIFSQSRECMGSYQEASVSNRACGLIVIGKKEVKVGGFNWLRDNKAIRESGLRRSLALLPHPLTAAPICSGPNFHAKNPGRLTFIACRSRLSNFCSTRSAISVSPLSFALSHSSCLALIAIRRCSGIAGGGVELGE